MTVSAVGALQAGQREAVTAHRSVTRTEWQSVDRQHPVPLIAPDVLKHLLLHPGWAGAVSQAAGMHSCFCHAVVSRKPSS